MAVALEYGAWALGISAVALVLWRLLLGPHKPEPTPYLMDDMSFLMAYVAARSNPQELEQFEAYWKVGFVHGDAAYWAWMNKFGEQARPAR